MLATSFHSVPDQGVKIIMNNIFKNIIISLLSIALLNLSGCGTFSWPNPNTGERSTDDLIVNKKYDKALEKLNRHNDEPWAQFRLGGMYYRGYGTLKDYQKAIYWYLRASVQMSDDDWSKGKGFYGKSGFYAQNYDAYNAQIEIGEMCFTGCGIEKNPVEACLWLDYALKNSEKDDNAPIPKILHERLDKYKNSLSEEEKQLFEISQNGWEPSKSNIYKTIIIDKNK